MEVRHFAARALVKLGDRAAKEAAAPVLREVLEKGNPDQRLRAELIVLLWKIGPEAAPASSRLDPGDLHAAGMMLRGVYATRAADAATRRNAVPTLLGAFEERTRDAVYRASYAHTLREMQPGQGVLVYGHLPPAKIAMRPWFKDPRLRRAANSGEQSDAVQAAR